MSSPPAFVAIRGLTLTVLRPHPDATPPKADCVSDWATHLTITHLADLRTGQPAAVRPIPASVPNSNALLLPTVPLYWLVRRSPGHITWTLIPAPDKLLTQQELDRHTRRWTASGNYACTVLSGLRELMGADYMYGAIAIHDQPHWNQS